MPQTREPQLNAREEALTRFIKAPDFPCVGAKSALGRGRLNLYSARSLTSAWDDLAVQDRLMRLAWDYHEDPALFTSFAVVFEGPDDLSEAAFERHMWERLQSLTDKDAWRGQKADSRVSTDPDDPHFSLSFGGEAFFVVGLHPRASRPARRFAYPALVFNLHDQFEILRAENRYEKLRESILERDLALAGSLNPMLARHGSISEARQYSGRAVDESWRCPYHRPEPDADTARLLTELDEAK
ncbi:YqcI/YcgG family protein [Arsenicitalea aurantiaca]|uniref:YqcI/YcgG family protein n=1 Tax=Arsenicitalea aurantiaca TaxID=1783274 RepID=A0A433X4A1_9HYPH|nr:guanitoxin biosynthesis heme-dependent pre-guanitoxin N-hydroxylase GntA [Arsenicitalea aurantiaca]RUT28896.1 YqcI/YcgG family protein [Arsenicitalea aurantiaca]